VIGVRQRLLHRLVETLADHVIAMEHVHQIAARPPDTVVEVRHGTQTDGIPVE
jgi:hypothetical protein